MTHLQQWSLFLFVPLCLHSMSASLSFFLSPSHSFSTYISLSFSIYLFLILFLSFLHFPAGIRTGIHHRPLTAAGWHHISTHFTVIPFFITLLPLRIFISNLSTNVYPFSISISFFLLLSLFVYNSLSHFVGFSLFSVFRPGTRTGTNLTWSLPLTT